MRKESLVEIGDHTNTGEKIIFKNEKNYGILMITSRKRITFHLFRNLRKIDLVPRITVFTAPVYDRNCFYFDTAFTGRDNKIYLTPDSNRRYLSRIDADGNYWLGEYSKRDYKEKLDRVISKIHYKWELVFTKLELYIIKKMMKDLQRQERTQP